MNLRFLFPVLIVICGLAAQAEGSRQCRGGRPSEAERKQWMTEMIQYKHDFMGRELELSDAQKEQFFSVYDKVESERWKLEREARKMEQEVRQKGAEATDLELEKAADAAFELEGKQHAVTMKYYGELKTILSKQQLFKLKKAERDFHRSLMDRRRETKRSRK